MFRTLITATALFLSLGVFAPAATAQRWPPSSSTPPWWAPSGPSQSPQFGALHVQIRHPNWRETILNSQFEMEQYVAGQRRNGWEVQVTPLSFGRFLVRDRLLSWGGSGFADTWESARWQERQLQEQGYQTRIMPR
jgi:hypothetical protein